MLKFLSLIFLPAILFADPWGKDADLCSKHKPTSQINTASMECSTLFFGSLAELLIGFHQDVISPADGPRSHYLPSSSQYTLEAMRKYGFYTGFLMGCDRLTRENSEMWVYRTTVLPSGNTIKLDPVK